MKLIAKYKEPSHRTIAERAYISYSRMGIVFLIPLPYWKQGLGCWVGCGDPLDCSTRRWWMLLGIRIPFPFSPNPYTLNFQMFRYKPMSLGIQDILEQMLLMRTGPKKD